MCLIYVLFLPLLLLITLLLQHCVVCIFHRAVVHELPATPSKFHYIFNLRDLSRIYHGLTMTTPDRFDKVYQFLRVWRNECIRVFFDRLINETDRDIVNVRCSSSSCCCSSSLEF